MIETKISKVALKINTFDVKHIHRLGKKKRKLKSKNPYKIKKPPLIDESKKTRIVLDGFLLMGDNKNGLPHEIMRKNLSSIY